MPSRPPPRCYVISLRPRGQHAALRRAAARNGAALVALSPWRLQACDDTATRAAVREALAASRVLFTSPAAVRAAAALHVFAQRRGQHWCAVGSGTAAALRRADVVAVQAPTRMDSEGLLALDVLRALDGASVGLVTAPGGRGLLLPALRARGARVIRADVYERVPLPPSPTAIAALRRLDAPAVLAVSSGEALQRVLAALPADVVAILRQAQVVAASARLGDRARSLGFDRVVVASGPRPAQLLAAATIPGRPAS